MVVNTYQALKLLNVDENSSDEEIKSAYRKMALELHPDRNKNNNEDTEFKKITEAYNFLKKNHHASSRPRNTRTRTNVAKTRWGAGPEDQKIPEQDWGKHTRGVEESEPDFWKEYEKNFWNEYNARVRPDGRNGEYEKAREPDAQPNLYVDVDKSKCIGCCSCETIAPSVFEINKESMMNPKSRVINQRGAGVNKIMSAAQTCPTKAIIVENCDTRERMFPY